MADVNGNGEETSGTSEVPSESGVPAGIIIPPPDIREVVEKTVGYVIRNGAAFVDRIRDREKSNVKFSFLYENDPYYAYYGWRLVENKQGRGATPKQQDTTSAPTVQVLSKPADLEFCASLPPISAQDLEIIKLTARYVARNGHQFLMSLSHRESKNFQFDFLRLTHSFYLLFTSVVEQFKEVVNPLLRLRTKWPSRINMML